MPTLHMICGMTGSGKTTLARQLEQDLPALRLCPDEWMARIVRNGYDTRRRAAVEAVQMDLAERALALGLDVILENGFWSRRERDEARSRAATVGATVTLYYLDIAREEQIRRLTFRNANLPSDSFKVSVRNVDLWAKGFEAPGADELE